MIPSSLKRNLPQPPPLGKGNFPMLQWKAMRGTAKSMHLKLYFLLLSSAFSTLNLPPHIQASPSLLETITSDVESNAGSVADLKSLDEIPNDKVNHLLFLVF